MQGHGVILRLDRGGGIHDGRYCKPICQITLSSRSHTHLDVPPLPGPLRQQIGADAPVQIQQKFFIQRMRRMVTGQDSRLHHRHPLCQQRGQLRVAQDALRGFNKAGGSIRASVSRIFPTATGSRSKAMLRATIQRDRLPVAAQLLLRPQSASASDVLLPVHAA